MEDPYGRTGIKHDLGRREPTGTLGNADRTCSWDWGSAQESVPSRVNERPKPKVAILRAAGLVEVESSHSPPSAEGLGKTRTPGGRGVQLNFPTSVSRLE